MRSHRLGGRVGVGDCFSDGVLVKKFVPARWQRWLKQYQQVFRLVEPYIGVRFCQHFPGERSPENSSRADARGTTGKHVMRRISDVDGFFRGDFQLRKGFSYGSRMRFMLFDIIGTDDYLKHRSVAAPFEPTDRHAAQFAGDDPHFPARRCEPADGISHAGVFPQKPVMVFLVVLPIRGDHLLHQGIVVDELAELVPERLSDCGQPFFFAGQDVHVFFERESEAEADEFDGVDKRSIEVE